MGEDSFKDESSMLEGPDALERRFGVRPKDFNREITERDIQWLLDHCPFVQVVAGGGAQPSEKVKVLQAPSSNWPICHYGDAMCASPGPYVIGGGNFRVRFGDEDEDEGGSGSVNPGTGTIINQAFMTAYDMVMIAKEEDWLSMHVVDCHRVMGRAIWIHGAGEGVLVTGFEPDENDHRIKRLLDISYDQFQIKRSMIL